MLELVRAGLQRRDAHGEKNPVFDVRGRQVTLADALHYFNRKGIKDVQSLLDQASESPADSSSSPSDFSIKTPSQTEADVSVASTDFEGDDEDDEDNLEVVQQQEVRQRKFTPPPAYLSRRLTRFAYAERRLESLAVSLGLPREEPLQLIPDITIPQTLIAPLEYRYMEAMLLQTQNHYRSLFTTRNMSVVHTTWTATSDDSLADKFYYDMYYGYSYLWAGERGKAFVNFHRAFDLIQDLLSGGHVAFLIYIYDLIIRYQGSGQEEPLIQLLDFVEQMAMTVFKSENHPVRLIALWMKQASDIRSSLAEFTLRRILDFFQDSIGYFHPETVALLQTFAFGLMNRERYKEAAVRFQQLVNAFQTTRGPNSYEVCYALRSTADAYFHQELYPESLQALRSALENSRNLPLEEEEKEIYVRCLRGIAEISKKLGRHEEAHQTMQHVVDTCRESWGPDHAFTRRAVMHLQSLDSDDTSGQSSIPPMIYRLGRGGRAAKYVWTPNTLAIPLQP